MGQYGFVGVGWVIVVSAVLQSSYDVECARYIAADEVPVVGRGRVPPGKVLWIPLSVFIVNFAFIAGGRAGSAGQGLFALLNGRVAEAAQVHRRAQPEQWRRWHRLLMVDMWACSSCTWRCR